MLSNIFDDLDSKLKEEQNITEEEDLKNNIILDSGPPIDLFRNPQLVADIKRRNQVLNLYTNVISKTNRTKVMVTDYSKVWYDDRPYQIYPHLTILKINT